MKGWTNALTLEPVKTCY